MNAAKHASRKAKPALEPGHSPTQLGRRRKLVLVVDDMEEVRELMKVVLEKKLGVKAVEAESSEQAFRIAKRRKIDLVISDYGRAGMDGLTFLREFKALYPQIPVVMLTGQAEAIRRRARQLGASGCVSKAFMMERLNVFERALR